MDLQCTLETVPQEMDLQCTLEMVPQETDHQCNKETDLLCILETVLQEMDLCIPEMVPQEMDLWVETVPQEMALCILEMVLLQETDHLCIPEMGRNRRLIFEMPANHHRLLRTNAMLRLLLAGFNLRPCCRTDRRNPLHK